MGYDAVAEGGELGGSAEAWGGVTQPGGSPCLHSTNSARSLPPSLVAAGAGRVSIGVVLGALLPGSVTKGRLCWYVNFEEPCRRRAGVGIDTLDLCLDRVVAPDLPSSLLGAGAGSDIM
ncbi:DUF402 domain-containing protein [Streptomyces sp. CBMA123]|uniref:DUF402 domain-containing protein n=1 Tax=Streptomyces sp. CBMA123 TaxID=1896313 RepID=UPI001661B9B5|nr:DUF402 domain-containing protein [Streptomyces sp. CBMA123]MBD0693561.1 hypothetical protein [Streptomyces sp. CBMA123]